MMKKAITLSLILVIVLSLAACQSKLNKSVNRQPTNKEQQKSNSQAEYVTKEVVDKETIIDKKHDFEVTLDYIYDDYGRLVKVKSIYEGDSAVVERYKYNEQGKKIYSYDSSNDDGLEEEINYEYNDKGQLIKKITKREDGFMRTQKFEYNQTGKKIKELDRRQRDGEIIAKFKQQMKYNKNNKLIELKTFRNDKLIDTEEYAYDEQGNKILAKKIGTDPMTGEKYCKWYEWEYDDEGRILKEIEKNRTGKIVEGEINKYNEEGKKVKTINLTAKRKVDTIDYRMYDNKGRQVKLITKDKNGQVLFKNRYFYDKHDNNIKVVKREGGKITDISKYEYDKKGNVIKSIWIDVKNEKKKIDQIRTHRYDKYGNKILEIHKNDKGVILEKTKKTFFGKVELKSKRTVTRWEDGLLKGKYQEKYNKRGDLIKEVEVGGDVNGVETFINKEYQYKYKKIKIKGKGD